MQNKTSQKTLLHCERLLDELPSKFVGALRKFAKSAYCKRLSPSDMLQIVLRIICK